MLTAFTAFYFVFNYLQQPRDFEGDSLWKITKEPLSEDLYLSDFLPLKSPLFLFMWMPTFIFTFLKWITPQKENFWGTFCFSDEKVKCERDFLLNMFSNAVVG